MQQQQNLTKKFFFAPIHIVKSIQKSTQFQIVHYYSLRPTLLHVAVKLQYERSVQSSVDIIFALNFLVTLGVKL